MDAPSPSWLIKSAAPTVPRCSTPPAHSLLCRRAQASSVTMVADKRTKSAYKAGIAAAHRKRAMHVCTECGKSFSKSSNLHTHVRTVHLKQKHGPCRCCSKWFASKQSWRQHLNTQRSKTLILLEKDEAAPCSPHLSLRMPRSHQPTTCIAPAPPRAYTKPETSPSGSSKPSLGLALAGYIPTQPACAPASTEPDGRQVELSPLHTCLRRAASCTPSGKPTTCTAHAAAGSPWLLQMLTANIGGCTDVLREGPQHRHAEEPPVGEPEGPITAKYSSYTNQNKIAPSYFTETLVPI